MPVKLFYDIESGEKVTINQLYDEYQNALQHGTIDYMMFSEYVYNSLTSQNGTLEIIG